MTFTPFSWALVGTGALALALLFVHDHMARLMDRYSWLRGRGPAVVQFLGVVLTVLIAIFAISDSERSHIAPERLEYEVSAGQTALLTIRDLIGQKKFGPVTLVFRDIPIERVAPLGRASWQLVPSPSSSITELQAAQINTTARERLKLPAFERFLNTLFVEFPTKKSVNPYLAYARIENKSSNKRRIAVDVSFESPTRRQIAEIRASSGSHCTCNHTTKRDAAIVCYGTPYRLSPGETFWLQFSFEFLPEEPRELSLHAVFQFSELGTKTVKITASFPFKAVRRNGYLVLTLPRFSATNLLSPPIGPVGRRIFTRATGTLVHAELGAIERSQRGYLRPPSSLARAPVCYPRQR